LAEKAQGEWLLILNPDAQFAEGGLERLWQTAHERPRAGVVAPRIGYPDGRTQPTVFPPYTFGFDLRKSFWLEHNTFFSPALRNLWGKLEKAEEPFPVGWASGACLLVRREVWEKTGGFDPNFFFGGEDADFCRRVWEAGFQVLCEPRALLSHQGGQSLQKEYENRIFYYYQKRMYFARKHFSRMQYIILYLVSFFELVLKWLAGLVLGIFAPEWRAKRKGYAKTLAIMMSPQFRNPAEWLERWMGGKTAKVGLVL
jgi:GT2 family glycosyltransferase